MDMHTSTRKIAKAHSEVGYATDRHHRGTADGKHARRVYHRAVRRSVKAAIAESIGQ